MFFFTIFDFKCLTKLPLVIMSKYFPRNVLKLSVAQLSQAFNYEAADNLALDLLTDVAIACL